MLTHVRLSGTYGIMAPYFPKGCEVVQEICDPKIVPLKVYIL
jgi:hypothetical protein